MLKMLSYVCGGELKPKEVAYNCLCAAIAIAVIVAWGICCYALHPGLM